MNPLTLFGKIISYFSEAYQVLSANKTRTALSMLGIVMGISSVVVLQTIGEWAQNQITSRLSSFWTNNLTISTARASDDIRVENIVDNRALINDDMIRLIKQVSHVTYVVPAQSLNINVEVWQTIIDATIKGIDTDYIKANTLQLYKGILFESSDYETISYKGLIGAELAQKLFNKKNPLGQKVLVGNNYITIIGIISTEGSNPISNPDNSIFVPLKTMKEAISQSSTYQQLSVVVDNGDNVELTKWNIQKTLQTAYYNKGGANIFSVSSNTDFLASAQQIILFLQLFLGAVAGISLLIGGIGIMNIMLVSVSERTREIGIRKAVWAHNIDIMLQFLCESSWLTLVSGVIGIALSYLLTLLMNKFNFMDWGLTLSVFWLTIWVIFSIWVGIIFGILPARKAANMKLVDALRFE